MNTTHLFLFFFFYVRHHVIPVFFSKYHSVIEPILGIPCVRQDYTLHTSFHHNQTTADVCKSSQEEHRAMLLNMLKHCFNVCVSLV